MWNLMLDKEKRMDNGSKIHETKNTSHASKYASPSASASARSPLSASGTIKIV